MKKIHILADLDPTTLLGLDDDKLREVIHATENNLVRALCGLLLCDSNIIDSVQGDTMVSAETFLAEHSPLVRTLLSLDDDPKFVETIENAKRLSGNIETETAR